MTNQTIVKDVEGVVVLFSGDSGDGMQLSGTIFSNLSAVSGNQIATFPDFPAEAILYHLLIVFNVVIQ